VSTAGASIPALRAVNALLLLFLPFLISDLLGLIRDSSLPQAPLWRRNITEGLVITSFPLVFFYGFLYYTDVASLVLVLLVYRQALRKSYVASALVRSLNLSHLCMRGWLTSLEHRLV
jgi:alpha-1,2-glucosyltransferase